MILLPGPHIDSINTSSWLGRLDDNMGNSSLVENLDLFEFTMQQQAVIEAAKKATVRIAVDSDKTNFDGSGTLVGKLANKDGSVDYYVLTAAHLSEREGRRVDIWLTDGRSFEGEKFNSRKHDLALVHFNIAAGEKQIADNSIAKVASSGLVDKMPVMIAGFPVIANEYYFKGARDPHIKHNLQIPVNAGNPSPAERFSALSIDTEAYVSLDVIDVSIARSEAQLNNPFSSDPSSIVPLTEGNTALGMSGGGVWGISGDSGQPVVYAVHNGRVWEATESYSDNGLRVPVTRLSRETSVNAAEVIAVIERHRKWQAESR